MITLFTGPMFSNKSGRLIETYTDIYDSSKVKAFKPSKDSRDKSRIKSRSYNKTIEATVISSFEDILKYLDDKSKVIIIDEVQFLKGNSKILLELSNQGYEIYTAGLLLDSELNLFGETSKIMYFADKVETLYSSCYYCRKKS